MQKQDATWHKAKVLHGKKVGRTIGFPTVNLDPAIMPLSYKEGVYATVVKHKNNEYNAALFFGPRKVHNQTSPVLEIYILDFDKNIYGETIMFQIKNFLRNVQNFNTIEEMKEQIEKDIEQIYRHSGLSRIDLS